MKYARTVALVAGVLFVSLAVFIQGVLPALIPESQRKSVTKVVRTDLGEPKWAMGDATDYTPLQAKGRQIYIREGCWYCHSQYVRPIGGESRRWGLVPRPASTPSTCPTCSPPGASGRTSPGWG